jgi:hypothetical protein
MQMLVTGVDAEGRSCAISHEQVAYETNASRTALGHLFASGPPSGGAPSHVPLRR